MRAVIQNFRGVKRAEIDLSNIAIIGGNNAAGKSSIAQAVAAALSGEPIVLDGLKKTDAGMLVHSGAGKGEVRLEAEGGSIVVTYPQAKVKTEGTPPAASLYALGRKSLLDLNAKDAAAVLIEYLRAAPTREDVEAAVAQLGLQPAHVERLWQTICDLGWDGAHQHARETGIKMKGQWEAIAGERYGPAKAESWLPKNWDADLEGASDESLTAALTQAREFLEAAIAATAVSDAERTSLQEQAAKQEAIRQQLLDAQAKADAAEKTAAKRWDELNALPKPEAGTKPNACPHCGKPVRVMSSHAGYALVAAKALDEAADAKRAEAVKAATGAHSDAVAKRGAAEKEAARLQAELKAAGDAAKRLAELPSGDGQDGAGVEQAREAAAYSERRLAAFRAKRDADRLHAGICINAQVVALLATDGLRMRKLRDAVAALNRRMAETAAVAGWGAVEIQDDLSASYDGKPLVLLSESEKFRARVVVQATMALMDGSAAIVVDAADILDRNGRNGLIRLLCNMGKPSLVCMTLPRDAVPSMPGSVAGYWIDNGNALPAQPA